MCEKQGLKIAISATTRTVKEQEQLYAKGRTDPSSKIVTNARGFTYSSMHQWGVAFDFYRNDGKGAYNTADNFFQKVGKIGKSIGLEWGGSWKSFKDMPHFQLPYWGTSTKQLKALYKNPADFKKTWKPTVPKQTIKKGSNKNDVYWLQIKLCELTNMNLVIDGLWGPKTSEAVTMYQKTLGWNATGKAGEKTINALKKGRIK